MAIITPLGCMLPPQVNFSFTISKEHLFLTNYRTILGVGEENMKIREYFVPNLVEDLKGQGHSEGQDKVTGHMNGEISVERDKAAAKTLNGIRNRKTAKHLEKIPENGSSRNLKFTAIYEPANQSTVRGKWLFMDLMNTKVVVLSMFRSLPWYLWLLGIMAFISDVIFKTRFVSNFISFYWKSFI